MLIRALSSATLTPILRSHGWPCLAPCEATDGGFRYPIVLGPKTSISIDVTGLPASIRIQPDRELSPCKEEQVKQAVRHMLSLDFPLDAFIAMCQARKAMPLRRLACQGWGRMFRSPSYWEDAVKTLCTTNASWGYTQKMCANLCTVLGRGSRSGPKAMPLPGDILAAGERVLVDDVGMGYRSRALVELAERVDSGAAPWLCGTGQVPDADTAERVIRSWHGFGKYATRHLLVLMGYHQYLPIDREVGNHLGIRQPGDKGSDLDSAHFDDWGEFRFTAYKLTRVARRMNWIGD